MPKLSFAAGMATGILVGLQLAAVLVGVSLIAIAALVARRRSPPTPPEDPARNRDWS